MKLRRFPEVVESASVLDPPAKALAGAIASAVPAGPVKDALSGTWVGAGAATVGGYLGGHLISGRGVGVDHTAFEAGPTEWTPAGSALDLEEGRPIAVRADGVDVLVYREGDRLLALSDRCTHRGGPLHEGRVEAGCIVCPWHDSAFRLEDGEIERGPAARPQPRYEARVRDGIVEVREYTA